MDMKKLTLILLGIMLISFSIGFYSLRYIDNFQFSDYLNGSSIEIVENGDVVSIGGDGIRVLDGDTQVSISWKGIEVIEDGQRTVIGFNGISVGNNFLNTSNLKEKSYDTQLDAVIDSAGIIKISSTFANVSVYSTSEDKVSVVLSGSYKGDADLELKLIEIPGGIEIKALPEGNTFTVVNSNLNLKVGIPSAFEGSIEISTSSANVSLMELALKYLDVNTSSGSVKIEDVVTQKGEVITSSGSQVILPVYGNYRMQSSSGSIGLLLIDESSDVSAQASSGELDIDLKGALPYRIEARTSSGNLDYSGLGDVLNEDKDRMTVEIGDSSRSLDLSTSSGNININMD
jgi:hypothetical protein